MDVQIAKLVPAPASTCAFCRSASSNAGGVVAGGAVAGGVVAGGVVAACGRVGDVGDDHMHEWSGQGCQCLKHLI